MFYNEIKRTKNSITPDEKNLEFLFNGREI